MFDYHMHSKVSYDSNGEPLAMVQAAREAGLKEICFTDHMDPDIKSLFEVTVYQAETYLDTYRNLSAPDLKIRFGMEFGLKTDNKGRLQEELSHIPYDFVLGSVHATEGVDIYFPQYWEGKTLHDAYRIYLENTLACVEVHDDYDVLGHLTYAAKCPGSPNNQLIRLADWQEIGDEILKVLVKKGKGMEVNTSGIDRCGDFLPGADFLRRFKELGGEIVTVGSDAHGPDRIGKYIPQALEMLKDIFGHVCTFEGRKPVFHKL